jgi:hypothetical protein
MPIGSALVSCRDYSGRLPKLTLLEAKGSVAKIGSSLVESCGKTLVSSPVGELSPAACQSAGIPAGSGHSDDAPTSCRSPGGRRPAIDAIVAPTHAMTIDDCPMPRLINDKLLIPL